LSNLIPLESEIVVESVEILQRAVVFQEDQKQKVNFPFITALVQKQEALPNHMFQEVKGDLQKFQNEQTKVSKGYKNQGSNGFNKYKGRSWFGKGRGRGSGRGRFPSNHRSFLPKFASNEYKPKPKV